MIEEEYTEEEIKRAADVFKLLSKWQQEAELEKANKTSSPSCTQTSEERNCTQTARTEG
ncbi:hypothetical protein [Halobacteriovorax sp. JY17]|uniref:hypothetical protein n=1 Tax=Halobacteriovorax sp. JY17 TaxID=2014617 RepID=UPI0025BD9C47|nr:hypothetical protein [Halobacteriovorax sp. JY17]